MNRNQCIDELIYNIEHKLDKYINTDVIKYTILQESRPVEMSDYLVFTFNIGFLLTSFKCSIDVRIDNYIDLIFKDNMIDKYTDAILRHVINEFMGELKTFIFYRRVK